MPSAVPIFYGLRESDVEEITNAITKESTRLVNIWGSPGFGKTSTAVETAHKLSALGYPVYFFHLQGIDTVDKFLSKILSIFGSNLADINLTAEDKLISIFTKISRPIILILDNIDDLLTSETTLAKLVSLFLEFLNSNSNINILVTSRELLEDMRDQIKGFQNVRIGPLSPASSANFVRQLLPSFSENLVSRVTKISSHVPLAMKLVTSMIKDNSENMANKVLDELELPEHRMEHLQQPIQKFFDMPYEQLTLNEKHALISLTVFSSATINKDAAINVVSGEKGSTSYAIKNLKTLLKKSLIDEDLNGEYYSIHPLIFSFIVDKANGNDLQSVLHCAKVRFCNYYLLTFERINEDFLSGLLVHDSAMDDILLHFGTVVYLVLTNEFESSQQVLFRILSKAEIFLFMIQLPLFTRISTCSLYDHAIQKHKSMGNYLIYSKLFVSYYFQTIAFSFFVVNVRLDIPEDIRIKVGRLLDGTAAKLSCYEGIFSICNGHVKDGIQKIEMSFDSLQNSSDQRLLKCLCLQILILYYNHLKEFNKVDEFKKLAFEVCKEVGNIKLFLIDPRSMSADGNEGGEALILFSYLLMRWSLPFSTSYKIRHICDFVYNIQQRPVSQECCSHYFHQIHCYADSLVVSVGFAAGHEALLDEKIEFLTKSREKLQDRENELDWHWSERLLNMYSFKGTLMKEKHQCVETCRKALDISLQHYGKQHMKTAQCYLNISFAENANDNHSCALNAIDQVLNIIDSLGNQPEAIDFGSRVYLEQGKTYEWLGKFTLAIESCEKALEMRSIIKINEESEIVAEILAFLALVQANSDDLASAVTTSQRCLQIRVKLFSEKKIPCGIVAGNHLQLANVYMLLGNRSESIVHFEHALQLLNASINSDKECVFRKCLIYLELLQLKRDEDLYTKLLLEDMHVIKEHYEEFLPVLFLKLAGNQLELGKYEAGLASLQEALGIELDVLRKAGCGRLEETVYCYLQVRNTLLRIGKPEVVGKLLEKAIEVSGLLPKCRQPYWLFCCYSGKAVFHGEKQEYVEEIHSFKEALLQFSQIPDERKDNMSELLCRLRISRAQINEKNYEEALKSSYEAISVVKNIFPEGSEVEADLLFMVGQVANELNNKKLVVCNLRSAYKTCSKALGENHPKTHIFYLTYVQALMN